MSIFIISGVSVSYLGTKHYRKHINDIMNGRHLSQESRKKYKQYVDWQKLPDKFIPEDYKPHSYTKDISEPMIKYEAGYLNHLNWPLMAEDLSNLPPAYILTCEFDPLRDDGILYHGRLVQSGVDAVHDHFWGAWHGWLAFAYGHTVLQVPSATQAFVNATNFIEKHLTFKTNKTEI